MMRSETFHTPGDVRLRVLVPAGEVDIQTVDGDQTHIELESSPEVEEAAVIEARGDEVSLEIEERGFRFLRPMPKATVRVSCPHGTRISLRGVSSSLSIRGRAGAVEAQTVSGEVEIEQVEGDLEAGSVSGKVTVGSVSGRTKAQSVSGNIRVDQADGPVTVQTVSGGQRIGSVSAGAVVLESVSGDMRVGIRDGTYIWMDVKSFSGKTSSDLPVGDEPVNGDGPTVELRANSTSGSIRITRA